jgi:MFS family permease
MIVLRALQGVGAAMTIPAATNLIVNIFPEPALQEIAIAIFGGEPQPWISLVDRSGLNHIHYVRLA